MFNKYEIQKKRSRKACDDEYNQRQYNRVSFSEQCREKHDDFIYWRKYTIKVVWETSRLGL